MYGSILGPGLHKLGGIPSTQERVGITLVENAGGLYEVNQHLESQQHFTTS